MAHDDSIGAAAALYRTMVHREDHAFALRKRHDLGAGLHARTLLGENEFAAGEIVPRLRQENRNLQWEQQLTVDVLMPSTVSCCSHCRLRFSCRSRGTISPAANSFSPSSVRACNPAPRSCRLRRAKA